MGASKRLAELVVQAHAAEICSTRFAMVRFGNVLGSSGSVVLSFAVRSLRDRSPSHAQRSFVTSTIPEAASLVLRASVLAQEDVFLLDMGDPVRIKALAEQMVRLVVCASGCSASIETLTSSAPGCAWREAVSCWLMLNVNPLPIRWSAGKGTVITPSSFGHNWCLETVIAAQDVGQRGLWQVWAGMT